MSAKKVLIVEDELAQQDVLATRLSQEGFEVVRAQNGIEGLARSQEQQPDLILLDIRMPEMSGYEMLKRLRKSSDWGARVPVIFLTNIQMTDETESLDVEGTEPAHYFVKSDTDLDQIIAKIQSVLAS